MKIKFKEYISEVPYIHDYKMAIPNGFFDVEEELHGHSLEEFVNWMRAFMDGQKHKDKYGNILKPIKTTKDKIGFVNAFLASDFFDNFDRKYKKPDWKKLLIGK